MKKVVLFLATIFGVLSCSNDECIAPQTTEVVKYDYQDNLIQVNNSWIQNMNLDTNFPINWVGFDGASRNTLIEIYSAKKITNVIILEFNYPYYVHYGNGHLVTIYSNKINDYRNDNPLFKFVLTHNN